MKKLIGGVCLITALCFGMSAGAESGLYGKNLFKDSFYECNDTESLGARFTAEVDEEVYYEGNSSIKLTKNGSELFKTTIPEDITNKTVTVSFMLRKDEKVSLASDKIILYHTVIYTDEAGEEKLSEQVKTEMTPMQSTTDWQKITANPKIDADSSIGTVTGIEFFVRVNNGALTRLGEGSLNIDCISCTTIPNEGELPTVMTQIEAVKEEGSELVKGIKLSFDTEYINEKSFDDAKLLVNGNEQKVASVEVTGESKKEAVIYFEAPLMVTTATLGGIKDIWGYSVDTSKILSVDSILKYTKNLFGENFEKCDTDNIGTNYKRVVDNEVSFDEGGSSIRIGGESSYGYALFEGTTEDISDRPQKLKLSFWMKVAPGTKRISSDREAYPDAIVDSVRFFINYNCEDESGKNVLVTPYDGVRVNGSVKDNDEWTYVTYTYNMDYTKISQSQTLKTAQIHVRPNEGVTGKVEGSIWIDNIKVTRVPGEDEYLSEFDGSEPANGESAAKADKLVLKYTGPVEEGKLTSDLIKINNQPLDGKITAEYNADKNETKLTIIPTGGLKNNSDYTVEIGDIPDMWGRNTTPKNADGEPVYPKISFKTKQKYTVTTEFLNGSKEKIENLERGSITAKTKLENNTGKDTDMVLVLAVCKNQEILNFVISGKETAKAGDYAELQVTFPDFAMNEGEYLRAFLWDSATTNRGFGSVAELG